MRCCVVFCFLFVCFVLEAVDGLKASDKGVCTVKHTVTKTRPKTVVVALSKWCGKKKCTVRQTRQQKYTVASNRLMCCTGFVYTPSTDSCAPVCSTGCVNGTCVDPNVCRCAPPLYLDTTTKNKCLTPVCDHPCINSQCTVNNTCTCLEGHVYFNSTHCAPNCTVGYELSSLTCIPKCDGCDNGTCVSPNVCECHEGYSKVNGSCQPVCKERCVNGWCSAPGVCTCDEGFTIKNATVCQRSCTGECRANGTCIVMAKNPKTRIISYEAMVPCGPSNRNRCPKKMTKKEKYGEELPVEICCDLYEYVSANDTCVPTCENECEGGHCVAPNVCICDPPLVLDITTKPNKCVLPVCDNPCVNGVCTANNQCTCNNGYEIQADNFTCVAQCTNCTNGDCVSPNVCQCHEGYTMNNNQCIPLCKNGCGHGVCSDPDICTCDHGYEFKNNTCTPICETSCVNADCVAPNTCGCWKGYKSKDYKEICTPECRNDCTNGFCSSPNVCTCNLGYELVHNKCQPICEKSCVNATCISPNTCECLEGFWFKTDSREVCSPKCESCVHGVCIAPNRCQCHKGYTREGEYCEPVCEESCVNGYCSGPNECTCKPGYTQSDKPSVCTEPCVCEGGTCLNGKCQCEKDMNLVNDTTCVRVESSGMKADTTTGLASLQMTWWVAGAVGVLLMVLVLVSISRIWHTRKNLEQKPANNDPYGSVIYTLPNTLVREEINEDEEEEQPSVNLLSEQTDVTR